MPYCEVEPGVPIYYEAYGRGKALVLIHGGGMSHEAWEQQVYELAEHCRVVTVDLRGHGYSAKTEDGYTFDRMARDLNTLVAYLDLKDVTVVGHGIGGYIAALIAIKYPHITERLCLVSSGARFMGVDSERGGFSLGLWADYKEGMSKDKVAATRRLIEETFFYRDPGPAVKQRLLDIAGQWPVYAMKALARDMEGFDMETQLGRITCPTLIMHGGHDRKQRFEGAQYLASRIKGARAIEFSNSAHNPQLEEVDKFNRVLLEFMMECGDSAAS